MYSTCPACQTPLTLEEVTLVQETSISLPAPVDFSINETFEIDGDCKSIRSSKVEMLIQQLIQFRNLDPTFKCVVFSQWTGMLKIVSRRLTEASFKWVLLDGSMSRMARSKAMSNFAEDPSIRVFLASLTAGNLGINLTSANYAVLLDPWWNPATENRKVLFLFEICQHFCVSIEAVDRIHRVGQTRAVTIYKYIVSNSVEERILKLQEKKRQMFETAVETNKSREQLRKMMVDDLKELFM